MKVDLRMTIGLKTTIDLRVKIGLRMKIGSGNLAPSFDFEFVFTDNHSTDGTWSCLKRLAKTDSKLRAIRFSKNFGYQRSVLDSRGRTHQSPHPFVGQSDCGAG